MTSIKPGEMRWMVTQFGTQRNPDYRLIRYKVVAGPDRDGHYHIDSQTRSSIVLGDELADTQEEAVALWIRQEDALYNARVRSVRALLPDPAP
jgi:hypothetical protein